MFCNDYSSDQHRAQDRTVNIKKHLSNMSPSEIIDEIENIFLDNPSDDMDVDQLITYLEHLDQVAPIDEPFDVEESYKDFMENHSVLMETSNMQKATQLRCRPMKLMRRGILVAIALCIVLGACTFAYATSTPFAQWVNETFSFNRTTVGSFTSLQEALDVYNIKEKLVPQWLPPNYTLLDVQVNELEATNVFFAQYVSINDPDAILTITIRENRTSTMQTVYEKDPTLVSEVSIGTTTYYVSRDNEYVAITWAIDSYECSISGLIEEDDVFKIINSIN